MKSCQENYIKRYSLQNNFQYIIPHVGKFSKNVIKEIFNRKIEFDSILRKVSYITLFEDVIYLYMSLDGECVVYDVVYEKKMVCILNKDNKEEVANKMTYFLCSRLNNMFINRLLWEQRTGGSEYVK